MQELRKNLDRKADVEGMKKGLTFLENKITQVKNLVYSAVSIPHWTRNWRCNDCSKGIQLLELFKESREATRKNWAKAKLEQHDSHKLLPSKSGLFETRKHNGEIRWFVIDL